MDKFGIGQPVRRREDARLVTGAGCFTDDIDLPGQAYGHVVRSPHAHARLVAVDTAEAAAAPGVLAVLTVADADTDGLGPLPCLVDVPDASGRKMFTPPRPVLARDRVRYVGDPVAFVVAETASQAQDAAERVAVEYEELPSVTDTASALAPAAPVVWPERGDNLCVHWKSHPDEAVEDAFAAAAHVVELELVNNRVVGSPMEPRVALGDYDPDTGRYTLYSPTQGVIKVQGGLASHVLKVPPEKLRVVSRDVGGGFGLRGKLFAESSLVVWAARRLSRPVKWTADRSETFLADPHGRDQVTRCALALDRDARILGMRAHTVAAMGAYLLDFGPRIPTAAGARVAGTVYRVPVLQHSVQCVFTHTVPTDAYRGAGRPEMCYQMERLLDVAASELGIGRDEIRRRNFIPPDALPYENAMGMLIDSGEFERTMDLVLERADWSGFESRRAEAAARGKLRGIGIGYYIEASGGLPSEQAQVRVEPSGEVVVTVGTFSHGQGHETAFAQVAHAQLGVPLDRITLRQGDTDFVGFGNGTGGSRSSQMGGVAVLRASDRIIAKARLHAAGHLEAAAEDLEFAAGEFRVAGTDLRMSLPEVARAAWDPAQIPPGLEPGLDETCLYERDTECNFPNGCHVCEIEIDRETGQIELVRYHAVDDCGRIINPLIVAGQVHGGVAMGLGQALLEHTVYDPESGQLLSASYLDYALPRAGDFPSMEIGSNPVWNPSNELGVKGIGEGGACGAPPAIIGAITDALRGRGVRHVDMPVRSETLWRIVSGASAD